MRRAILFGAVICAVASASASGCGGGSHPAAHTTSTTPATSARPAHRASTADAEVTYRRQAFAALATVAGEMAHMKTIPLDPDPAAVAKTVDKQSEAMADGVARLKNLHPPARYRTLHHAAAAAMARQYAAYLRCLDPLWGLAKQAHPAAKAVNAAVRRCFAPIAAHGARDARAIVALLSAVTPPGARSS